MPIVGETQERNFIVPMAFLHEHIILPLSDVVTGQQVHKYLRKLREAETWSAEQMCNFQQHRLRELVKYVAREVPFYQDWFHDQRLNPQDVTLKQMPIINKTIMRQEGIERFSAIHFPSKYRNFSQSSGSTGEPFSFYVSREASSINTAAKLRTWYQSGYCLGDSYMKIANGERRGKLKKWQDRINRCIYVPFYSIDDISLSNILDTIEREHPLYIRAYPAPIYLLACYRNRHPGYTHSPRKIFTTGSTLSDDYRKEIEKAFGCNIIDSYSCEGTPNTYEISDQDGYRVCGYYGIIEVLDNDGHPIIDGIGRVVSTDLWNRAFPFIRYDTQDLVEVLNGEIIRIMGRESDAYLTHGGEIYTVHNFSHYFIYNISGVDCYQMVRHHDDIVTFNIVTNKEFDSTKIQDIIDYWRPRLGVTISVNLVDEIPLMNNNKRRTIIFEP